MVFWIIIWVLLLLTTALLIAQEIINGSNVIRFNIIILLFFALILIAIFTIGAYQRSYYFYQEFVAFQQEIDNLQPGQMYVALDRAAYLNYQLTQYQEKISIFTPYYRYIRNLAPISFS